jgi:TonB family protein
MLQAVLAAVLVSLPVLFPQQLTKIVYQVTPLAAPKTEVLLPPKPEPVVRAKVQPPPAPPKEEVPPPPLRVARLVVPKNLVAPKPKPVETQVKKEEAPQVAQALTMTNFEAPTEGPARPREPVKTGVMTTGSAAPATVSLPLSKVQTGGFGDPQGLPGEGNPNKAANIARLGSPALPPGPGYGNGTGGANGVRGTVASAGFGNGVAIPPPGGSSVPRGEVKAGGFAAATVDNEEAKPKAAAPAAAAVQPVVILEKPNPVYSDEARKLAIEGEVLVEVVFPAAGPVRVGRVIKGLGHGLDEAAIRAAEQIRFKPALQAGQPVDFPATVHIVFQLAF